MTIFQKTPEYSRENVVKLFNSVDLSEVLRLKPIDAAAPRRQFQMIPVDLANRFPIQIWLLMVWGLGILTYPFTFAALPSFAYIMLCFSHPKRIIIFIIR